MTTNGQDPEHDFASTVFGPHQFAQAARDFFSAMPEFHRTLSLMGSLQLIDPRILQFLLPFMAVRAEREVGFDICVSLDRIANALEGKTTTATGAQSALDMAEHGAEKHWHQSMGIAPEPFHELLQVTQHQLVVARDRAEKLERALSDVYSYANALAAHIEFLSGRMFADELDQFWSDAKLTAQRFREHVGAEDNVANEEQRPVAEGITP